MKLTDARRRGLEVLMLAEREGRQVRLSNYTTRRTTAGTAAGFWAVYWQTAEWLKDNHLADISTDRELGQVVTLRSKGRQVAREAGLS